MGLLTVMGLEIILELGEEFGFWFSGEWFPGSRGIWFLYVQSARSGFCERKGGARGGRHVHCAGVDLVGYGGSGRLCSFGDGLTHGDVRHGLISRAGVRNFLEV